MERLSKFVTRFDDRIEKIVSESAIAIADKYQAVEAISRTHNFRSPKVLSIDVSKSALILDRVDPFVSLRDFYIRFLKREVPLTSLLKIVEQAGSVLGHLHSNLELEGSNNWEMSSGFLSALNRHTNGNGSILLGPVKHLHCDFSINNICIGDNNDPSSSIIVLDPCANRWLTKSSFLRGPVYLDLGVFLFNLEASIPLIYHPKLNPVNIVKAQKAFIEGYEANVSWKLDNVACFSFARTLGEIYYRSRFPRFHRLAQRVAYNHLWKRNSPLSSKLKLVDSVG
jgi:hypothetical protein